MDDDSLLALATLLNRLVRILRVEKSVGLRRMLLDINPMLSARKRRLRAALITSQLEGLTILIGPKRIAHKELNGLEDEAIRQIQRLAMDD